LRDARAAACLFSVVFEAAIPQSRIDAFLDRLQRFKLGWSWAGPVSLCAPYHVSAMRTQPWTHAGGLVRFAIGLEAVADLQADLQQAWPALQAR
jgi:cystathionine beta-lyase